jgi:hypothetical protein
MCGKLAGFITAGSNMEVITKKRDTAEKAPSANQRVATVPEERPKGARTPLPEASFAPWKLSHNAVMSVQEAGYQVSINVEIDNYDQGCYALDTNNHANEFFLGLDSDQESTAHLYNLLFDSKGNPKMEVAPDSYIEDGGNLGDSLTPRGPFEGMRQLILRGGNIKAVLCPNGEA